MVVISHTPYEQIMRIRYLFTLSILLEKKPVRMFTFKKNWQKLHEFQFEMHSIAFFGK